MMIKEYGLPKQKARDFLSNFPSSAAFSNLNLKYVSKYHFFVIYLNIITYVPDF